MTLVQRLKLLAQGFVSLAAACQLRRRQVGHIHCHFAHAPATVGMYAARQLRVPFSFTGHANDLFQRRALLKRKLQRAAFVACISQWHREFYASIIPDQDGRYRVIRCGVDTDAWRPSLAIPAGPMPLRVLTVCRLVEKKGIDTLLHGLAILGQRCPRPWQLTVAGDGPQRQSLEQLARQLGCADNVRWLGPVQSEQVQALMAEADVFVLPCRNTRSGDRDGIPVVLMEAMACGLPVVAGDLPAIRELVQHGVTGLLFPGEDPSALADCLALLDGAPEQRRRLGAAGRQRVQEEFSLDLNVSRLEAAIRSAAGGRGAPPGQPPSPQQGMTEHEPTVLPDHALSR